MTNLTMDNFEAEVLNALGLKEIVDFLRMAQGLAGNDGDDVEGDLILPQEAQ